MHPLRHSLDVGSLGPLHVLLNALFTIRIHLETAQGLPNGVLVSDMFSTSPKEHKFNIGTELKARNGVLRPRLDLYTPTPAQCMLGQPREGGGGSPHPVPSQSIMGPPSHWSLPSHVTLLFLYKKPTGPLHVSHSWMIQRLVQKPNK